MTQNKFISNGFFKTKKCFCVCFVIISDRSHYISINVRGLCSVDNIEKDRERKKAKVIYLHYYTVKVIFETLHISNCVDVEIKDIYFDLL